MVYGRDTSGKLPRKTPKRTKPKWRDAFKERQPTVLAYRSDSEAEAKPSLVLKNKPLDGVYDVFAKTKERNEVLQLLDARNKMLAG